VIELVIPLQPKQKLFLKTVEETPVTFYGGAKGGGKSEGLRMIQLLRRLKYPGSYGAIFRKTFPELEGNHIRPLFSRYPMLSNYWNSSKKILTLPNGSTIEFCYCESEADIDRYQGREFHDLAIDEAGQWTEAMVRKLQGSNRSSKNGIRARTLLTGNPGGVGHTWLKRLFIERRYNERERASDYAFIQALVDDNPALIQNDPDYVHRLNTEPNEALRKAYRYGSWDIHAGQFFGEIRREVHVIKPFDIPSHWNRFGAYDYGFNHPAAFGWFACDEDGNVYLYREFVKAQLRVDEYAKELNKYADTSNLEYIVAGWDAWVQKGVIKHGSPPTVAEEFSNHGLFLRKAVIDRIQGAAQVRKFLAWQNLSNGSDKPKFFIFDTCPASFDALNRMQTDPDRVEDVLKQDATEGDPLTGDDAYDMTRYGLMSRPWASEPAKIPIKHKSKEWFDAQAKRMEDEIDRQAEQHKAMEMENDTWAVSETENDLDAMRYYINKKKGIV